MSCLLPTVQRLAFLCACVGGLSAASILGEKDKAYEGGLYDSQLRFNYTTILQSDGDDIEDWDSAHRLTVDVLVEGNRTQRLLYLVSGFSLSGFYYTVEERGNVATVDASVTGASLRYNLGGAIEVGRFTFEQLFSAGVGYGHEFIEVEGSGTSSDDDEGGLYTELVGRGNIHFEFSPRSRILVGSVWSFENFDRELGGISFDQFLWGVTAGYIYRF